MLGVPPQGPGGTRTPTLRGSNHLLVSRRAGAPSLLRRSRKLLERYARCTCTASGRPSHRPSPSRPSWCSSRAARSRRPLPPRPRRCWIGASSRRCARGRGRGPVGGGRRRGAGSVCIARRPNGGMSCGWRGSIITLAPAAQLGSAHSHLPHVDVEANVDRPNHIGCGVCHATLRATGEKDLSGSGTATGASPTRPRGSRVGLWASPPSTSKKKDAGGLLARFNRLH